MGKSRNAVLSQRRLDRRPGWRVSLGIRCRLFRRERGMKFNEIAKRDLNDEAEILALRQGGLPDKAMSDHRSVRCLGWSGDSKMILIKATGSGRVGKQAVGFDWT